MARAAAAALRRRGCSLCWHGKACGRVIWRELKSRHWPIARFSTLLFFWRGNSLDLQMWRAFLVSWLTHWQWMIQIPYCRFCLLKGRILNIACVAREVAIIHAMDNSRIYVFLHLEAKACCGYDDDDPFAKRSSNFHPSFYLISWPTCSLSQNGQMVDKERQFVALSKVCCNVSRTLFLLVQK